jgi:thiol-disulfide isomerase/thioredoxin
MVATPSRCSRWAPRPRRFVCRTPTAAWSASTTSPARPDCLSCSFCNHCPFVKHIRHDLARLAREYQAKGLAVVAINSNDVERYQDDSPQNMARREARGRVHVSRTSMTRARR